MSDDDPIAAPHPEDSDVGLSSDGDRPRRTHRPDPLLGTVLDQRYLVVGLIARGGMGRVYRAEQAPLGRVVAVKVLDVGAHHQEDAGQDREFRKRFIREAETCARLTHPHTVRVFDYGQTDDDVLFIAMEYLEGRNLFQAIRTDAPMDAPRVIRIARQIASSLREAHSLGLIHRDLKPSNIILTRPGGDEEFVKVVDFGLVKEIRADAELTRDDALVGSPSYMSPEQIRSAALDQRSDLYSLGVLIYACLTGRAPFTGATSLDVLMGHLHRPPPPLAETCPSMMPVPALEAVVLRCLAKDPADRYASMDELLGALQACAGAPTGPVAPTVAAPEATVAVAPSPDAPSPLPSRGEVTPSSVAGAGIGAFVALALLAGSAVWWTAGATRAPPAHPLPSASSPLRAELRVPAFLTPPEALPAEAPDSVGPVASPLPAVAPSADASTAAPAPRTAPDGAPPSVVTPRPPDAPGTPTASNPERREPTRSAPPVEPTRTSDIRDPWVEER